MQINVNNSLALFPCLCYSGIVKNESYKLAVARLASARPALFARAAQSWAALIQYAPSLPPDALRRWLWVELVFCCRMWVGWGGPYA